VMKKGSIVISVAILIVIAISLIMMTGGRKDFSGNILITFVPEDVFSSNSDPNLYSGSQLAILDPQDPSGSFQILTDNFFAAMSPQVSYDGKRVLFTGKMSEEDFWQIFEMDLDNLKPRQITSRDADCFDPAYLSCCKIVFSSNTSLPNFKIGAALFTSNLDGTAESQITHHPHYDASSVVLADGKILTLTQSIYPAQNNGYYMSLRPDGTMAEMFFKGSNRYHLYGRALETQSGNILLIESTDVDRKGGDLIKISYARPLHSKENLTGHIKGCFLSISEMNSNTYYVCYRPGANEFTGLYSYNMSDNSVGEVIYSIPGNHIIEHVAVTVRNQPRQLPSRVDNSLPNGYFLCMNSNTSYVTQNEGFNSISKIRKVEILGLEKIIGEVEVETDGSFYIEITADTPVRFLTKGEDNEVLSGPSSWVWVRPNERRSCIGCHEDRELVPENVVPLAINKEPVSLGATPQQGYSGGH